MILSIGGVTIPIDLVSSARDSIRRCVVLFKSVPIPTSDPKPEFLCQSSVCCAEPADPLNHLVCLGYLPRLHPSRITLTLKVPVLLLSTSSRSCSSNELSVLVAATLLKSSRMFHLNITTTPHTLCYKSAMKRQTSYNACMFSCPYKCGTYCHSASGLTQHSTHCFRNPANRRAGFPLNPTIWPPQTPPPTGAGPPTPSTSPPLPTPDHPSPLNSRPVTPIPASPHRHHWITNARGVRTRVHPYLNGSIISNTYRNITDITGTGQPCDVGGYELPRDAPPTT